MDKYWTTGGNVESAIGNPRGATKWPRTMPKGVLTERIEEEELLPVEDWDGESLLLLLNTDEGNWLEKIKILLEFQ